MDKLIKKATMYRLITLTLCIILILVSLAGCKKEQKGPVEIIFTSWRTEDISRMNKVNEVFMQKNPNIIVKFQPISDQEYDAQMLSALETGVGADIIFLRSYDPGRVVYDSGFLHDLNDVIPELKSFPSAAVKAWSTDDGKTYGVPSMGVTHGIYYRKDIFDKYGLSVPATWDEFMNVCKTLKDNGETVFAQGTMEGWPLYEVIYSGLGANFYGGEESRQKLMKGDMKLTDAPFIEAFKTIDMLQDYYPKGYEALDYVSMQQMYGSGKAAMFMGGSWEIGIFEDMGIAGKLGWFAPPTKNKGDKLQYCFHVDAGIGVNAKSKNLEAALTYIKWTATAEYAQLFMDQLPGFFSYTPGDYKLNNALAKQMIDAANGADVTVRTVWEKMSSQAPSGNSLMEEALIGMYTDKYSPEEAAKYIQDGLETWYPAFK